MGRWSKILLGSCFVFSQCRQANQYEQIDEFNDREIKQRMVAAERAPANDSVKRAMTDLDLKFKEMGLLTKDVENLKATIKRCNVYFDALEKNPGLKGELLVRLDLNMSADELVSLLKQNELVALNAIVLQNHVPFIQLSPVHEDL